MAETLHELLEPGCLALEPVAEHLVERLHHFLDLAEVLRPQLLHGARHVLEVRLRDLLLELIPELLESLRGALVHELVVVELADRAADVLRQAVQLLELLLRDLLHDALGALGRLLEAVVDALPLAAKDVVQFLANIAEDVVEVVALELLQALLAEALEHLLEARQPAALLVAPAATHQPVQRVIEVAALEQVFGEPVEELLGVPTERLLGPIPSLVAIRAGDHLAGVDRRSVHFGLVDPLAQMEPLEDKLHTRGGQCGPLVQSQALERLLHPGQLAQHGGVALRGLAFGHLEGEAGIEALHQLVELTRLEVTPEDVEHRGFDDLLQHGLVVALFPGFHLELAGTRGDDGGQVSDPRRGLRLACPQRTPRGVRYEVLVIGDRDADTDAGTLIDLGTSARQLAHLGHDFFHEVRHHDREVAILERGAFLLDDADLVVDVAGIMRPDLRAEAILERRDDPPAVRVVVRVGAGDHVDIDRQAQLDSADLHTALIEVVQQADLDPFGEIGQLVDGEDAAIGSRDEPVVDGELIGEVLT